jgi:S-(hydroxymethyl)glutathione dehydrogenase/alcohol dehydrogenase
VDRYLKGEIKIDALISEVLPLEKINKAFDFMHDGKVIRSVVAY